jgi:cobalt-zinc-cadmium efflux system protein
MLAIVIAIVIGAVQRLQTPAEVNGPVVAFVAAIGLAINGVVLWTLSHGEQDMNTRGAMLHVMGDLLGSVAALISGMVIWATGWLAVDPILSVLICVVILFSSLRLLREALNVFMEGVPRHLQLEDIGRAMANLKPVCSVHDLHVWNLSSQEVALSAHVVLRELEDWNAVLAELQKLLNSQFGIGHVTLQPERLEEVRVPISSIGNGSQSAPD